eukprot:354470-Chlamydomonas_euryale.AAC.39
MDSRGRLCDRGPRQERIPFDDPWGETCQCAHDTRGSDLSLCRFKIAPPSCAAAGLEQGREVRSGSCRVNNVDRGVDMRGYQPARCASMQLEPISLHDDASPNAMLETAMLILIHHVLGYVATVSMCARVSRAAHSAANADFA